MIKHNQFFAIKILFVCIGSFILQAFSSDFTALFLLDQSRVLFEPWRLLTAIFLHGNIAHLFLNMFVLAVFGSLLENILGSKKFLLVYFSAGIFASIVAAVFYPFSLGASGAIMGILGCLTFLRPNMVVFLWFVPMKMWVACIVWILIDLFGLAGPQVASAAHLGGIFVGLVLGYFLKKTYGEQKDPYLAEAELLSSEYMYK